MAVSSNCWELWHKITWSNFNKNETTSYKAVNPEKIHHQKKKKKETKTQKTNSSRKEWTICKLKLSGEKFYATKREIQAEGHKEREIAGEFPKNIPNLTT